VQSLTAKKYGDDCLHKRRKYGLGRTVCPAVWRPDSGFDVGCVIFLLASIDKSERWIDDLYAVVDPAPLGRDDCKGARGLWRPAKAICGAELVPMKAGRMPGIDDGVGECDEERGSWRNAGIRVGIPSRTEVKQNQ